MEARQEGKFIYYSVKDEKIKSILNTANELVKDASEEKFNCMNY